MDHSSDKPREWSHEEVRDMLLDQIWTEIEWWLNSERAPTTLHKLEGLAFSILSTLDGCGELPSFTITPRPHPTDKSFHQQEGENWFPDDGDVAGSIHELFYSRRPKGLPPRE